MHKASAQSAKALNVQAARSVDAVVMQAVHFAHFYTIPHGEDERADAAGDLVPERGGADVEAER